jgi:hypothetical protein
MKTITLAQREALDVVKDMIDKSNPDVPEYGTKIITLILGILNIDCRVEHTITQIDGDKITPIQVWYNHEPEPIQTNTQEDVRYVNEITCTDDKNGIVHTTNTTDVRYNGDFRDVQTSFNDK